MRGKGSQREGKILYKAMTPTAVALGIFVMPVSGILVLLIPRSIRYIDKGGLAVIMEKG